jgi:hypothetical protein
MTVTIAGPRSAPSNLIGANGFAGQDHCSRVCGAKHRCAAGAPLTVILSGKRILGTVGRTTRTDQTWRGAGDHVTASNHILREAGPVARRRWRAQSAPARQGATDRRPRRGTDPRHSPLRTRWTLALPTHSSPALRVYCSRSRLRGLGPRMACRRRALETVEKVVTPSVRSCVSSVG